MILNGSKASEPSCPHSSRPLVPGGALHIQLQIWRKNRQTPNQNQNNSTGDRGQPLYKRLGLTSLYHTQGEKERGGEDGPISPLRNPKRCLVRPQLEAGSAAQWLLQNLHLKSSQTLVASGMEIFKEVRELLHPLGSEAHCMEIGSLELVALQNLVVESVMGPGSSVLPSQQSKDWERPTWLLAQSRQSSCCPSGRVVWIFCTVTW